MHTLRTRFKKDIVCEFLPPLRKTKKQKVVILADGMPTVPSKRNVMEFFVKKSFWVFHPRYRGTWESGGRFLKQSPEKDILDVIESLPKGFKDAWSGQRYAVNPDKLFVIGGSFGGPAALLLSGHPKVTKAIAIAPVIDWQSAGIRKTLRHEYQYVREIFGEVYRFFKKDWHRLGKNSFYNPVSSIDLVNGKKLLIIHAKDDDVVSFAPSKKFAKKINAEFVALNRGGHVGHSILLKSVVYNRAKKFLT